jgi:hypothetical protein
MPGAAPGPAAPAPPPPPAAFAPPPVPGPAAGAYAQPAGGGYPAPPGGGGFGGAPVAFSAGGAGGEIPLSPWAAMAPVGRAPPPAPSQQQAAPPMPQAPMPQAPMAPVGLAGPPAVVGFGAPPGMPPVPQGYPQAPPGFAQQPPGYPQQGGYPQAPAFAPPPNVSGQMLSPQLQGPPPMSGGGPVAPPPIVGFVGGAGLASPAPPMVAQGPGFGPPPPVVAPPPPVPPAALQEGPGALSGPARAPMAPSTGSGILVGFLVTFQNEPNGIFWSIRSGRTQLGRAGSDRVDIGINDASSSSRHASINADPATGQAYVQDDGSRNGTFLNEQKLGSGEQRQLHDNDRLRLGSTTLVVKLLVS